MSFIQIKGLRKEYGSKDTLVVALDNIDIDIEKGSFVVILGASGAGKTTLLNLLGGMDKASGGSYLFDEDDVSKYDDKKLERFRREDIGFVFQFYNLMENLTALENVSLAASIVKNPLDPKKCLEDVGLKDRMKNFPSQLSGGEQQRVSIARAIVKNPRLLLCDEPTGALDSKTGLSVLKLLYSLSGNEGMTVVVVTHNQKIAQAAQRLIRIQDGHIVEDSRFPRKDDLEDIDW